MYLPMAVERTMHAKYSSQTIHSKKHGKNLVVESSPMEGKFIKTLLMPLVFLIGLLVGCAPADNTARNQTLIAESGMPPEAVDALNERLGLFADNWENDNYRILEITRPTNPDRFRYLGRQSAANAVDEPSDIVATAAISTEIWCVLVDFGRPSNVRDYRSYVFGTGDGPYFSQEVAGVGETFEDSWRLFGC
jgi:hypothetical protein